MLKSRIHIVDDDRNVVEGLRRNLRSPFREWDVEFHVSASDCLASIDESDDYQTCLVVTDWEMPGMDGMALLAALREREAEGVRSFYVIVLTGKNDVNSLVHALDAGADDYLSKPFDRRELVARARCGLRVLEAETSLRDANHRLEAIAKTDALTQIANRRHAEDFLGRELERVGRELESIAVLLIDIDHFKQFNDTHGHAVGDEVLQTVASRLESRCRRYDLAARWGGEEFLLICPHVSQSEAALVAERVRGSIGDTPFRLSTGAEIDVTISVGVARASAGEFPAAEQLIAIADDALYRAKDAGRNRAEFALETPVEPRTA